MNENRLKWIRIESLIDNPRLLADDRVKAEILNQKSTNEPERLSGYNFLLGVITHSFDDTQLPITLDCIFSNQNWASFTQTKVTIRGCFNYGTKFHTMLWHGHNHLAILDFEGEAPDVVISLPLNSHRKRWHYSCFICQSEYSVECSKVLREGEVWINEFMRIHNPHIYRANLREEKIGKVKESFLVFWRTLSNKLSTIWSNGHVVGDRKNFPKEAKQPNQTGV